MKNYTTCKDKKFTFKAKDGADFELKEFVGEKITVNDVIMFSKTDENGEDMTVTVLVDTNGKTYSTISPTIATSTRNLVETFLEPDEAGEYTFKEPIDITVISKKSNNKREFFQLDVL